MKKVLAFALSLVLILGATLPGTLAVSIDADTTANEMTLCTCGTEDGTHAEDCPQFQSTNDVPTPAQEGEEGNQPSEEDVTPAEGDGNQPSAPEDEENGTNDGENADPSKEEEGETPDENAGETAEEGKEEKNECTCGAENGEHNEDCPLYDEGNEEENTEEEPEEKPDCTCGIEDDVHSEDCSVYAWMQKLYEKLMATTTVEEFDAIIATCSEEELVFGCKEFDDLDAHYIYLSTGEYPNYEPIVDVVLNIVDFTNAAPLVGSGK